MNWSAAFYTVTIWMLAASIWQLYRPLPETATHREAALRVFRDVGPAILLGLLMARVI
jgi:hypothetical protein